MPDAGGAAPLREVRGLRTYFDTDVGEFRAVDGVSFTLAPGETLGVVGESGCGKSVTSLSIMGLIPRPPGRIAGGEIRFEGVDLLTLPPAALRERRGNTLAMIFQEPMTSLNPAYTVGDQIMEVLRRHRGMSKAEAREHTIEMLRRVRIPSPEQRVDDYPHKLSGGMRQRVMIAMALACGPKLLIADEPTTALDVTIQAQILDLFNDLTAEMNTALVMITHDLGVVAGLADRVAVMYAGRIVEEAPVDELFENPAHPYTAALHASIPRPDQDVDQLAVIPGRPPNLQHLPKGCSFSPRCPLVQNDCIDAAPRLDVQAPRHLAACFHAFPRLEEVLTNG
jgi:oligopeptide transport system ATP-binding protein